MTYDQIREELLGEHASIRAAVEDVRAALTHLSGGGTAPQDRLRDLLRALQALVGQHNAHEEQLLRSVIRHIDAWGDVRELWMDVHHAGEHRSVLEAIDHCFNAVPGPEEELAIRTVLDRLLLHMDDEEKKILHPSVLTDAIGPIDPFGG